MNWNDWEMIWRRQEKPVGAAADVAVLRQTFEEKRRKLARSLFIRDVAEASAGVFVSLVLTYIGWHLKKIGWPIAIAVALVLGVTGFFVRERLRTRRLRLGHDASLLAKLEAELAELRHQRRLLWNIWPWYLGPIVAAWAIVGITVLANLDAIARDMLGHPLVIGFGGSYLVLCLVLFWAVWVANRRAVRTRVDPRIEELEKLRGELTSLR